MDQKEEIQTGMKFRHKRNGRECEVVRGEIKTFSVRIKYLDTGRETEKDAAILLRHFERIV